MGDKASYRNRGGFVQKMITYFKGKAYFNKIGAGSMIKKRASFAITDNAYLEMGENSTILDYAFFQLTKPSPKVFIGDNSSIGRHCIIACKDQITIGNSVLMGAYVQIIDHSHGFTKGSLIRDQKAIIKRVTIGDDVWIGTGVKILMGVSIGEGVVIGANAVVTSDIPPYAIAVGVPAVVKGYREPDADQDK